MISKYEDFDLTYVTIDSLSEGVGSSQISPLISLLSKSGLKIKLISFEKFRPSDHLSDFFVSIGVDWNPHPFGSYGLFGGLERLNTLRTRIPKTRLIHARSDIPAVSAITSKQAPVLWDVRSLWADQKLLIHKNFVNFATYPLYRGLESVAASQSLGMSTLTNAVVPFLEQRHKKLPQFRTVVPTAVDLNHFQLSPSMPTNVRALFSGSFNNYYDLGLSKRFMQEIQNHISVDIHWARPVESHRPEIEVGESKIFPATQIAMASIIPNYSFGVSICKLNAGPSLLAAMPTKIGEFLSCGRPVVINKGLGDMDQFILEFNAGVILDGSPDNLAESASKLASLVVDPETPLRCRALAEKYFSLEKGVAKYLDLYSRILGENL